MALDVGPERRADFRLVAGDVVGSPNGAGGVDAFRDGAADLAGGTGVETDLGDDLEGLGVVGLLEPLARLEPSTLIKEDLGALRGGSDGGLEEAGAEGVGVGDVEPVGGEPDGGLGESRKRQLSAVALQQELQQSGLAGNGGGERPGLGGPGEHDALGIDDVLGGQRRASATSVEDLGLRRITARSDAEDASAAESGGMGFDDADGERDGDGGLDGVSTLGEDLAPGLRGQGMGGDDHALLRPRGSHEARILAFASNFQQSRILIWE